jgi:hypothetical protein
MQSVNFRQSKVDDYPYMAPGILVPRNEKYKVGLPAVQVVLFNTSHEIFENKIWRETCTWWL